MPEPKLYRTTFWATRNGPAITLWHGEKPVYVEGFGWSSGGDSCIFSTLYAVNFPFIVEPGECVQLGCEFWRADEFGRQA